VVKKVLVADDAELFRVRVASLLSGDRFQILQASCGSQAVRIYKDEHPDLVLLDLSISNIESMAVLHEIQAMDPDAKVVMLSMLGEENEILEAIKSGARDYVRKPLDPEYFSFIIDRQFAQP
jgi:two-component system chemotaxis response regulator CheY